MRKQFLTIAALTLTLAGGLVTGCAEETTDIGQDSAKKIALEDAGVAESDATRFRISKDKEDGRTVYEVEFSVQEKEYSYDIAAADGEIMSAEQDIDDSYVNSQNSQNSQTGTGGDTSQTDGSAQQSTDQQNTAEQQPADQQGSTQQTEGQQSGSQQSAGQQNTPQQTVSVAVSEADARKTALERVPGASEQDMRMELEFDDGQYVYEGDIIYQNKEYEFEIDANTGNFLKWSEENY